MVTKPVDSSRIFAWKEEMFPAEIADFEDIAGPLLQRLGYEVMRPQIPVGQRIVRSIYKLSMSIIWKIVPHVKGRLKNLERVFDK